MRAERDPGGLEFSKSKKSAEDHRSSSGEEGPSFAALSAGLRIDDVVSSCYSTQGKQEREIVYVILICVENEASYNPFYAALSHRLCTSIHHFKLTFQFAYWDRFKTICGGNENPSSRSTNIGVRRLSNLARLLSFLVVRFSLSLAMLKVVEFGPTMTKRGVVFFRVLFHAIMNDKLSDKARVNEIFSRIANSREHSSVRDGIHFFLQQHLLSKARQAMRIQKGERQQLAYEKLKMACSVIDKVTVF